MTAARYFGLTLAAALGAWACGGGGSTPARHPARSNQPSDRSSPRAKPGAAAEKRCSLAKRVGTYQVQINPFSTTCPKVEDYQEHWDGKTPPLEERCTLDMPDRWSQDGCTLERAFTCELEGGGSARTVMTSTQKSDDGSILAGMLSLRRYDRSESLTCQGTYSFTSSRD